MCLIPDPYSYLIVTDAFSFSRREVDPNTLLPSGEENVFTPNYFYFGKNACDEQLNPGLQAADDLRESRLQVGSTFGYSIRSVAKDYSFSSRTSKPATVNHKVQWEASIDGSVTLSLEAGKLPVEGVRVFYQLRTSTSPTSEIISTCDDADEEGWCSLTTGKGGGYKISIQSDHDALNNDDDFPVYLRFSKTTGGASNDEDEDLSSRRMRKLQINHDRLPASPHTTSSHHRSLSTLHFVDTNGNGIQDATEPSYIVEDECIEGELSGEEYTMACSDQGLNCCATGSSPCSFERGPRKICRDSCNGNSACQQLGLTHVHKNSCRGREACKQARGASIGEGSCLFQYACKASAGIVSEGSCNDNLACYVIKGMTRLDSMAWI